MRTARTTGSCRAEEESALLGAVADEESAIAPARPETLFHASPRKRKGASSTSMDCAANAPARHGRHISFQPAKFQQLRPDQPHTPLQCEKIADKAAERSTAAIILFPPHSRFSLNSTSDLASLPPIAAASRPPSIGTPEKNSACWAALQLSSPLGRSLRRAARAYSLREELAKSLF